MTRILLTLANRTVRDRALQLIRCAPVGYRVTIAEPKRTLDQNAKLHAMLDDFADQVRHYGRTLSIRSWKAVFLHALNLERETVPSLDGTELIGVGRATSDLSKAEMSDLIEIVYKAGAERGVVWTDPKEQAA